MTRLYCMECNEYLGSLGGTSCSCGWKEAPAAQREWQGLTGQETNHLLAANADCAEKLIRAIEAKLKEKNEKL